MELKRQHQYTLILTSQAHLLDTLVLLFKKFIQQILYIKAIFGCKFEQNF